MQNNFNARTGLPDRAFLFTGVHGGNMYEKDLIKNIAIIAHVDHGKTTLVDQLLRQSGVFRNNEQVADRVMDSNALEREKGITILAKNTSIIYNEYRINIVDTPGHADFGGEVERIMTMVDGVILVVDAFEGCMPQTRFVLKKALAASLKPIIVINKMDKKYVRPDEVLDEIIDLFIDLGADEDQLDFPVVYASGAQGMAGLDKSNLSDNILPLLDTIINYIPSPIGSTEKSLQFQVTLMDYDDYIGKIAVGKIQRGKVKVGEMVSILSVEGVVRHSRVTKLYGFEGLKHVDIIEAGAGEIISIGGLGEVSVGETICEYNKLDPLPFIAIEEPTMEMMFLVNNSPFAGKEGEPITSRKLLSRLKKEMESDIALKIQETDSADSFRVSGRGELHLAILIEKMRREGLEFQVSKPQVIMKKIDGQFLEPVELVTIDVPEEYVGKVIEKLSLRHGNMINMSIRGSETRLEYLVPSRGLIGFRTQFLSDTHGYGIIHSLFDSHKPYYGKIDSNRGGALIVFETGTSTSYGLKSAEERGTLFIGAGEEVYEGMIIGESNRDQEIAVNICKGKKLTNTRASGKDDAINLKEPKELSLEDSIAFLDEDEYLEITPTHLRLRKRFLRANDRLKYNKSKNYAI